MDAETGSYWIGGAGITLKTIEFTWAKQDSSPTFFA